jgi:predicted nucleic acid-binding protein
VEDLHLTVDIQVIMFGTGMSPDGRRCHQEFLKEFKERVFLALDREKQINQLYENRLGAQSPGKIWLANILARGRFRDFPLGKLSRGCRVKLEAEHFDPDDLKYIRLAIATPSKCLVTEDDDYTSSVCKLLRKEEKIHVCTAESACELIQANLQGDTTV